MKPRQIHLDNQEAKDKARNKDRYRAQENFKEYLDNLDLNKRINKLSYPSDFFLFRKKALLFKIYPYSTDIPIEREMFKYFTINAVIDYMREVLPKKAPNSIIKFKWVDEGWDGKYIGVFYRGEKG